jgi:hypothetical protein
LLVHCKFIACEAYGCVVPRSPSCCSTHCCVRLVAITFLFQIDIQTYRRLIGCLVAEPQPADHVADHFTAPFFWPSFPLADP